MTIKTQGTGLYFVDHITNPATPSVSKMSCPTGATGIGDGQITQIPTTCLYTVEDETFVPGLGTPGQTVIPFNFKPSEASHKALEEMKSSKKVIDWVIALSDGTDEPAIATDTLTQPAGRTSVKFKAYIANLVIDIATNTIVTGTLTLQRSGAVVWTYKS